MKLNRFIALTAIALLVVGAMGAMVTRSFALGSGSPVAQISAQATTCAQDQANGTEVASATDTDTIDLQCGGGDQSTLDSGTADTTGVEAPETASPSGN